MQERKVTIIVIQTDRQMMTHKATVLEQVEAIGTEERNQAEEPQETILEICPEKDIGIEDTQTEVVLKEGEIMMMTGTGRPAMARVDSERVARSP